MSLIPLLPVFHKFNRQFFDQSLTTNSCLLYTSDAADEEDSVDLGGRRIIKKNYSQNGCTISKRYWC